MEYYNPEIHHRRSIRLQNYDYSQAGAYFITLCTHQRIELFGEIKDNQMCLNDRGKIVEAMWNTLPKRFSGIELDHFIAMPNHIHGIIVRTQRVAPKVEGVTDQNVKDSMNKLIGYRKSAFRSQMLHEMVRTFKAVVSYHIRRSGKTPEFGWQREYYDHIIRNPKELERIRVYILSNPSKWQEDRLHPLSNWHIEQNHIRNDV